MATASILESIRAADISETSDGWTVKSLENWESPSQPLSCGNSGTTMRLLSGILASESGLTVTLSGDESLSRRPMARVTDPLRLMGAEIEGDQAPIVIHGRRLTGISYSTPMASAQVKSCLLLAGCRAAGKTTIREPAPTRDHTERMFEALGIAVARGPENEVSITGGHQWTGFEFNVPADISSSAFWMVAAAIAGRRTLTISDLGLNPTRTGILDVLLQAGVSFDIEPGNVRLGEPTGVVNIHTTHGLRPFEISGSLVPRLIDEIPVLCVLATQCQGTTFIRDAAELRVKESDRIAKMADGLTAMGANVQANPDGLTISGPTPLTGTHIDAEGDHRIAMAFVVAGLIADSETIVDGTDTIRSSYPDFEKHLHELTN